MKALGGVVLVTGGAGFIGSHVVDRLLGIGVRVRVPDNFRNGSLANLPSEQDTPELQITHGDVTDAETCRVACRNVSAVFHLACLGVRHSIHNPFENHFVNTQGTLNILSAAREAGVERFVYSGLIPTSCANTLTSARRLMLKRALNAATSISAIFSSGIPISFST